MAGFFFNDDELDMPVDSRPYPDELYIFGAGSMGRELLGRLGHSGYLVRAFLDNNSLFGKEKVAGLPVLNPETMRGNTRATVILASLAAEEMRAHCRRIGLNDVVSMAEAVHRFKMYHVFDQIDSKAAAALDIWDDDASRDTYRALVRFRATLDLSRLPPPVPGTYFTDSIVKPRDLRAFADCGAFCGDTYKEFRHKVGDAYDHYYGFEPDPQIYELLDKAVSGDPKAVLFKYGVGEKAWQAHFHALSTGVSNISETGSLLIQIDSLDNLLANRPVTMIKMDIEGHEMFALAGAAELVRRQRPLLAISCYHQLEHFWQVPLWIRGLDLGYRLRLLHHGSSYAESICYGIPG
jgi:FkbM family methyltransferase